MNACIVVPIKTNNTRLPGKNTKMLAGKPLYSYLFNTLKKVKEAGLAEIFVDSSDENILKIARQWNFKTVKRPKEYNSDTTNGDDLINRIVSKLNFEIVGQLFVTSPFLSFDAIKFAIVSMKKNNYDSLFGVVKRQNRFWFKSKPINHDLNKLLRTQDLTPVYEESDLYFFKKSSFLKYKKRICGKYKAISVRKLESVDIDYPEDFVYAESLIKSKLVILE
ncbi:MAG TPA: acylneuraminate cytidylyltransferase family protein [Candidatus Nanoarchaeia archaeon]|nr:acylneuraminate cytidylyltransferase family protein [Candidatus Nanoarchaeia archaeon]